MRHPEAWIVQPDGTSFIEPIVVEDITAKNAREKDKVVVEILSYPSERYLARGVIIEVLGRAGQYDAEIESIIHQFHLPRRVRGRVPGAGAGRRRELHRRADRTAARTSPTR